jgi:hypothetical protein
MKPPPAERRRVAAVPTGFVRIVPPDAVRNIQPTRRDVDRHRRNRLLVVPAAGDIRFVPGRVAPIPAAGAIFCALPRAAFGHLDRWMRAWQGVGARPLTALQGTWRRICRYLPNRARVNVQQVVTVFAAVVRSGRRLHSLDDACPGSWPGRGCAIDVLEHRPGQGPVGRAAKEPTFHQPTQTPHHSSLTGYKRRTGIDSRRNRSYRAM